ncbi:exonuclease domain-containing protein [Olivibacter sp. CPCC 100613]|uniref:exonuclease domain-containing protein n=1 Tax=Olivibacter sp. CPCC 100613 TaxID=3079931 RepID=UPI002FF4D5BE
MILNLKRPLAFFDLETTGVNVASDRIVEISILKAMPDGRELVKTLRINPEMLIPLSSSLLHGIYDEDIKDAPTFKQVAQEIADFLMEADLAGYNSNKFDIPVLMEEFLRAGVNFDIENRKFVDVQNIFHQMEQRTLKAAYKFYCDRTLENAHSAEADVRATYEVLIAQVQRYEGVEWEDKSGNKSIPVKNDVDVLHQFTNLNRPVDFAGRVIYDENGVEVFSFGKHKGKSVIEVFKIEPSYYSWMMQGDFPLYTKRCIEKIWTDYRNAQSNNRGGNVKASGASNVASQPKSKSYGGNNKPQSGGQHFSKAKEKSGPITDDMLKSLQDKFKK